ARVHCTSRASACTLRQLSAICTLIHRGWASTPSPDVVGTAVNMLERGDVLFLPELSFGIQSDERGILSPQALATSKNASFDPGTARVSGTRLANADLERLRQVMI